MTKAQTLVKKSQKARAATAVEYGMMLVAIFLLCVGAYKTLGGKVSSTADKTSGELQ